MKILVIDNYPGTRLGLVGRALAEAGASLDVRVMHAGDGLPEGPAGYDGMVVLGGGQSAIADDTHPYLPYLARLTRQFSEADKAVLGICLGSQVIARGHGAENILGSRLEFGWKEVRPTGATAADPVLAPLGEGAPQFHWHFDTFTLPPGAVHLAVSDQTHHQAFRLGRAVYGVQFHFEADRRLVREWTEVYASTIARNVPDWFDRHETEERSHGERADAVGLAMARAWAAQVRT
jgi:GMP synthase (glutamine-hydrolysing)